ncbi:hypothetical protein [Vibrio coralliirubri]|uniref:hypothetical protein n=1 Tax=Vibrio coralliirubri TaxID=1516159 RepID=UPI001F4CA55B|nr:hypothetical protein [Vibrio coralliirubri]
MMKNNNVTLDNELMEVCRGELKERIDDMGLTDFKKLLMLKNLASEQENVVSAQMQGAAMYAALNKIGG